MISFGNRHYWLYIFFGLLFLAFVIVFINARKQKKQNQVNSRTESDDEEQLCRQYRPVYNPRIWSAPEVIEYNNCYSYAFRNLDLNAMTKPQPGERSGIAMPTEYTCENIFQRVQADNPGVLRWTSNEVPCPCKHYKAFLAIDNIPPNTDYHFLRQDQDGMWSHKPGSLPVTRLDASGNLISDPMKANLNFDHFQYNVKCGFLCVPYAGNQTQS